MFLPVLVGVCCPGILPLCTSIFSGTSGSSDKPDVFDQRAITESHVHLPDEQVLRVVTGAKARDIRAAHCVPPLHFFHLLGGSGGGCVVVVQGSLRQPFSSCGGDPLYEIGTWRLCAPDTPVVATQGVIRPVCSFAPSGVRITSETPSGSRRVPDGKVLVKSSGGSLF